MTPHSRVRLAPLTAAEAAALFATIQSSLEALKRRLSWPSAVTTEGHCETFIAQAAEDEKAGRTLVRGIFLSKDDALIGVGSLQRLEENPGTGEVALWVRSAVEGKGYATESGRALIALAFKERGLRRLYSRIDPTNRGARKVLLRLGFNYEGCLRRERRLNGRWIDQECWGLIKEEA